MFHTIMMRTIITLIGILITATSAFAGVYENILNNNIELLLPYDSSASALRNLQKNVRTGNSATVIDSESSWRTPDLPPVIDDAFQIGRAYLTNFLFHEIGHRALADYVDAKGTKFHLLTKQNGTFFLGQSTYEEIADESRLTFSMAGEMAVDLTFERALQEYRKRPSAYNRSLLFFSGTDFLWYCFYAYYLSDGHPHFDPTSIANETGISKDTIFSIVLAKTLINAYRVYSGNDYAIPYFTVDKETAALNFMIKF